MKLLRGVQFEVKIQWAKNYSGPTHNPVSYSGMEMIITWDYSTEVHYKRNGDDYISFIWRNCTWWDPWYSVETGKTNGVTACCDHKTEAEVYDKTDGGIERALAWKVDEVWSSDTKWVCLRLNNPTGETSSTCFTDFQQFSFPELEVRAEYVHTYDGAWWTDTSDGVAVNIGADIWPPFVGANVSYSFTLKNDNAWILQEPSTGNFGGDLFPPLDSTHKYCSWVARDKPLWCSCCGGDLYCDPVFVQFDRRDSAFLPDTPARSYSPDGWLCNK
ncbi:MAG: hypothetical protein HQ592_18520 [Planctomycetes bacterium]|nr:hypothetical protein [Planctomycetota bacterium]